MAKFKEDAFVKSFAKRVRVLRQERNMTMETLAILCEVDYRQISRVESGQINTSISMAFRIARAFEISVPELFRFD